MRAGAMRVGFGGAGGVGTLHMAHGRGCVLKHKLKPSLVVAGPYINYCNSGTGIYCYFCV